MNKIIFKNNEINLVETDDLIEVSLSDKYELFDIKKIIIKVLNNTELEIEYKNNLETKLEINFLINDNVNFKLTEIREENKIKISSKYDIGENSKVDVIKFYDVKETKELDLINLNGINSTINYNFKTIAHEKQKYDLYVYHNYPNTESNIINNSVNLDNGTTIFNVTSVVYSGITNCNLNQANKIINLNDKECIINPNLLIEENDVTANHSAHIGNFSEDIIFYLMSRGIDRDSAISLLIKGFLNTDNPKIEEIINKYWR